MVMPALAEVPCPGCGKLFKPRMGGYSCGNPKRQLMCSQACWLTHRYRLGFAPHPSVKLRKRQVCTRCGATFEAHRTRKYCSPSCWHEQHGVELSRRLGSMGAGRRWNHRDGNEAALITTAEQLGALWFEGPPLDGWVYIPQFGRWIPVEIKQPSREGHAREFTKLQHRCFGWCEQYGAPWWVWRTTDDVLRDLGAR
jgi:hypothetical protein